IEEGWPIGLHRSHLILQGTELSTKPRTGEPDEFVGGSPGHSVGGPAEEVDLYGTDPCEERQRRFGIRELKVNALARLPRLFGQHSLGIDECIPGVTPQGTVEE